MSRKDTPIFVSKNNFSHLIENQRFKSYKKTGLATDSYSFSRAKVRLFLKTSVFWEISLKTIIFALK